MVVIDDKHAQTVTKLIEQLGKNWGMSVQTAFNGREALAQIRAQENIDEAFDVIILDYLMPGMNGMQTASRLLNDEFIKRQYLIIMLTGASSMPAQSVIQSMNVASVLKKPVSAKQLNQVIAKQTKQNTGKYKALFS